MLRRTEENFLRVGVNMSMSLEEEEEEEEEEKDIEEEGLTNKGDWGYGWGECLSGVRTNKQLNRNWLRGYLSCSMPMGTPGAAAL